MDVLRERAALSPVPDTGAAGVTPGAAPLPQPTIRHSVIPVEDFHRDGRFGVIGYDECWIAECPVHGVIGDADTEQFARAFDCPLCVQEVYGLVPIERDPADQRVREDQQADEDRRVREERCG